MEKYPSTPIQNPFEQSGLRNWLTGWRTEAKFWRIATLFSLIANTLTVAGLIYQSQLATVMPYVIKLDEQGVIHGVDKVLAPYQPTPAIIEFFVSDFIKKIRSLSSDPVLSKQHFLQAYDYVSDKGQKILTHYCRDYTPIERIKAGETCAVKILNTLKISESSYQVSWQETRFSRDGVNQGTKRWAGVLNILIRSPQDEEQLRRNPAGIFVDYFQLSPEITQP